MKIQTPGAKGLAAAVSIGSLVASYPAMAQTTLNSIKSIPMVSSSDNDTEFADVSGDDGTSTTSKKHKNDDLLYLGLLTPLALLFSGSHGGGASRAVTTIPTGHIAREAVIPPSSFTSTPVGGGSDFLPITATPLGGGITLETIPVPDSGSFGGSIRTLDATATPEPGSIALLMSGGLVLGTGMLVRRFRRR